MNEHNARSKAFEQSQHLLRGAVARLSALRRRNLFSQESNTRKPKIDIDEVAEARRNLQRVLNHARAQLHRDDYFEYLSYYYAAVSSLKLDADSAHFDNLEGSLNIPAIDLAAELDWISFRINFEKPLIERYLSFLAEIDRLIVQNDYRGALDLVNQVAAFAGHSVWSVQLRLALESATEGLEAQKRFYDEIKRRHKAGLLPYLAYQTSVRNEDRTTLAKFTENTHKSVGKVQLGALQHYLRYKLIGEWPSSEDAVADVLRIEQATSIIDLYESVVSLAQESVRREDMGWLQPLAAVAIARIGLADFRLEKIRLRLGMSANLSTLTVRPAAAGDYLFSGQLPRATVAARHEIRRTGDVWALIYRAAAMAHRADNGRRRGPEIVNMLASATVSGVAHGQLLKATFNLSGVPAMRAVYDLAQQLTKSGEAKPFRFSLASLNASQLGPEDISDEKSEAVLDAVQSTDGAASLDFWGGNTTGSTALQDDVRSFGAAVALERSGRLEEAISVIRPTVSHCKSAMLRSLSAVLLLRCFTLKAAYSEIINFVAEEASRPDFSPDLLPVVESLEKIPIGEFKKLGPTIEPLIALDVLQRATDSDKVRSQLRFSTKAFLRTTVGKRPSLVPELDGPFSPQKLIYFLRNVCVQSVIDMSGLFSSSSEVADERQAVCGALMSLDPENAETYEDEVLAIEHQRTISEGLIIVNKNRVHVDTDMIARVFERTSAELFARYVDLRDAQIGASSDFDVVLRELVVAARQGKQVLFAPDNEADVTLVQLVAAVVDEFLHNPIHGLDYFLSKRIRHQSFVGLVRGPLEFEQIITTKETAASSYRRNDFWLSRLSVQDPDSRSRIEVAFRSFAETFDAAVTDVKDRLFHVKSTDRPDGIFSLSITPNSLYLARAVAKDIESPAEFAKAICEILWVQLDPTLEQARLVISDRLKMQVAETIDKLKLALGREATGDVALGELQLAIGRASAAVQTALGEAEAWFNRPEVAEARRLFKLRDAVEVAIASAKKLHRAFDPVIEVVASDTFMLRAGDLVFLTDAVFIAFSNIRSYSGSKTPAVLVSCTVDATNETLTLEVINDVLPKMRSKEQDRRIEEIRALIVRGSAGKRVKAEGGTGFLKLSSVVAQSSKGRLEFGYIDQSKFRLAITWSFILSEN